jgi:hypothetical protein
VFELPKPIFDGWTEDFVISVSDHYASASVRVNDRMARIGKVTLDNTLREALFTDQMDLIIPFTDDPLDAQGAVSQIGVWSKFGVTSLPLKPTKGDIGTSNYVLGVEGPTDETAIEFNPQSSALGYSVPIPYSRDYTAPPGVTIGTLYKRYYLATWARTWDSGGAIYSRAESDGYVYQGNCGGPGGNCVDTDYRSLIGFNVKALQADLNGANIKQFRIALAAAWWWWPAGGWGVIGTHNYDGKPSTWDDSRVLQHRWELGRWPKIRWWWWDPGLAVAEEFRNGTSKGIAIGPSPTGDLNYYGLFYGAVHGTEKPLLYVEYEK